MALFLKAIGLIANLLPALLAFIKALEADMPAGSGSTKKAAVMEFLGKLLGSASSFVPEITPDLAAKVVAVADHVVDAIVGALNVAGVFKKTPPAATPAS